VKQWPRVPLGELLRQVDRSVVVDPSKRYRMLGVRWYGAGLFVREEVFGHEIAATKVYAVEPGDFVYNRLFAWKGSFAVADEGSRDCHVSNEFPRFAVDKARLDPTFLRWWFRRESAWSSALGLSSGATPTSRNRLKEAAFLSLVISLPTLVEQRRLVSRVNEVAAQIATARSLNDQASQEAEALWWNALARPFVKANQEGIPLSEACSQIVDNLHTTPRYDGASFACVRSQDIGWGSINFATALRTSKEEFAERTRRAEPRLGDIVFVREGDVGRCAVVSEPVRFSLGQRVMMFRAGARVRPRFLAWQLMSRPVLEEQILTGKTGTTSHHVNIKHLRDVRVIVPPMAEQQAIIEEIDALRTEVSALKAAQVAGRSELDALLPAILDRAFVGAL
jgi:type I restriction enzyme, S subunit